VTDSPPIRGVYPVLATPFRDNDTLDDAGLRRVVRYTLAAGADGLVFPAVASEFYALSDEERRRAVALVVEEAGGRVPVVVGTTAPAAHLASELSEHAESAGAAAVMVMAPYVVKENPAGVRRLYETVAEATGLPIVLQNAPAPLGPGLSVEAVLNLVRGLPRVAYVKEENLPCGQRISRLLEGAPASLKGVFGGAGGRYILDELSRGALGTMPACELTEVHVALYAAHARGDAAGARALFNRLLPLLNFQAVFRMAMTKEVLRRRGLIASTRVRVGDTPLDAGDQRELTTLLAEVADLLSPPAVLEATR